ncbi:MAG TPA: cytochrome c [Anaerolineae bacterium]|nr:cytochrome c [Anaerolineae bacterium]HIP71796.1 cytochrome c [Anaerolineae bacterium]
MKKFIFFTLLTGLVLLLAACGSAEADNAETAVEQSAANNEQSNGIMGIGNGMGSSMMARHHAAIPEEYAGLTNPTSADEASIERGAEIYAAQCASCHGDGGMGDGPAAANLDPEPAAIAQSSQMIGDDYLFWRISEGGAIEPFNSNMIAWKSILDEDARWDVINYVQALGSGAVTPGEHVGGAAFDPAIEAAKQEEILATAVSQGLITQAEADTFAEVHTLVDEQMVERRGAGNIASMNEELAAVLTDLVTAGKITQAQADTFNLVHDRLTEAGLM